jgi:hypothetical protein
MGRMILSTIEFSAESVSELDGHSKAVTIPRNAIRSISLQYGYSAERPIFQAVIGTVLVLIGFILGVYPVAGMLLTGEFPLTPAPLKLVAFAVPLVLIGVYMFYRLLVKRFHLVIYTTSDKRKLVFRDKLSLDQVHVFLLNCKSALGYSMQIETVNNGVQPIADKSGSG